LSRVRTSSAIRAQSNNDEQGIEAVSMSVNALNSYPESSATWRYTAVRRRSSSSAVQKTYHRVDVVDIVDVVDVGDDADVGSDLSLFGDVVAFMSCGAFGACVAFGTSALSDPPVTCSSARRFGALRLGAHSTTVETASMVSSYRKSGSLRKGGN
jgi:hypothetical protein